MTAEERQASLDCKETYTATEAGARTLDRLRKSFGDRPSYQRGDPYETAYNEGQRSVYLAILLFIAQADLPYEEPEEGDE